MSRHRNVAPTRQQRAAHRSSRSSAVPPVHRWRARWVALATAVLCLSLGIAGISNGAAGTRSRAFGAVADTFVNANYPTASFGRKLDVRVDDRPKIALLTFDIRALGTSAESAVLRLRATSTSASARVDVHLARDAWSETGTTYRSVPSVGPRIGSGSARPGQWTEITLDLAAVDGAGVVSLALQRSTRGRDVRFHSRESDNAPALILTPGTAADAQGSVEGEPPPSTDAPAITPTQTTRARTTPPPPATATATPPTSPAASTTRPSRSAPPGDGPFLAYEPDSFFRSPLPATAPVDGSSARGISLVKQHDVRDYPRINGVEGNSWGMPFAMSSCSDPVWRLTGDVPAEAAHLRTEGFHAPARFAATLTGTSDSPLVVVDRCGNATMPDGFTLWAAKAVRGSGNTIQVGSAGAFDHTSNGLDQRNPASDSDVNFRSRGAIPDAMVIRDDLLSHAIDTGGDLGHVLHMFWWETDSAAGAVHPMTGAESGKSGFGAEGMRIRIRPDVRLDTRGCSPAGLAVARTLQHYGAYLGDNSGSSSALKAEQGSTAITADALSCVTWDDFVFVQRGWEG